MAVLALHEQVPSWIIYGFIVLPPFVKNELGGPLLGCTRTQVVDDTARHQALEVKDVSSSGKREASRQIVQQK